MDNFRLLSFNHDITFLPGQIKEVLSILPDPRQFLIKTTLKDNSFVDPFCSISSAYLSVYLDIWDYDRKGLSDQPWILTFTTYQLLALFAVCKQKRIKLPANIKEQIIGCIGQRVWSAFADYKAMMANYLTKTELKRINHDTK